VTSLCRTRFRSSEPATPKRIYPANKTSLFFFTLVELGFSPNLPSIPFVSGNKNVTSSEVSTAFVGQVGSGDFTLDKQYGTNVGNINVGVYKLGNGATAYVASTNSTDLIIQLNSGQYLILGNSNTDALAASFSQNVYPLKP